MVAGPEPERLTCACVRDLEERRFVLPLPSSFLPSFLPGAWIHEHDGDGGGVPGVEKRARHMPSTV